MRPANRPEARPPGLATRLRDDWRSGQGIVEYGLILSLSTALAVILLVFFGGTLSGVLKAVGDAIDAAT